MHRQRDFPFAKCSSKWAIPVTIHIYDHIFRKSAVNHRSYADVIRTELLYR